MCDDQVEHARVLAALGRMAVRAQPRLFAIYGEYRKPAFEGDDELTFLSFGMDFPRQRQAVLWQPGETWVSDSAESVLERHQQWAEARLIWLDGYRTAHGPRRP
ncbi:hypothetical protein [Goodfellowiella coeruleoviolacea]|uniref:Uncharacterized protein n=1 Tax=Goodfellowiella coeruleoviolacea TaxID=334858 RepID=A0AAE3GM03_9PSEU|nr:hypothetical protein [Goodfellowiella coeruleoviolacea]MCP2169947.1 hypothetical protein [Goodfellowiella coeruleoviolacea]